MKGVTLGHVVLGMSSVVCQGGTYHTHRAENINVKTSLYRLNVDRFQFLDWCNNTCTVHQSIETSKVIETRLHR